MTLDVLLAIQRHLHAVIRERAAAYELDLADLPLPELEPLLQKRQPEVWFPVPGMYGGFSFWLSADGVAATLTVESWCRVVGGSGQRHEITAAGATLVAEG